MADAYIIDAVRTPRGIGKVGKGKLAHMHPQQLGAVVLKALKDRNDIKTDEVDDIIWSTSTQKGTQGSDLGRMSALAAGYDPKASGVTLDRFCGGGITSVNFAAAQIMSGMEDCVIAGGTEMMSLMATIAKDEAAANFPIYGVAGSNCNPMLQALHPQSHQGLCADAIASMEGFTREQLDNAGFVSQQRAAAAIAERRFDKSIVPVLTEDGTVVLDRDEFPRSSTTMESLGALKPAFEAMADMTIDAGGQTFREAINAKFPDIEIKALHHAGNSSGVVDGAAAILLASKAYADKMGWKPRARIVAMANLGDDPTLMLNAPVPAAKKALEKAGLTKDDIDLWEINEAFAVVSEKFIRDLDLDRAKVNVNGGSIAL
ncbi:MAG: acetyl-CoA C-acetyltransferase, partial [Novosphingobium sp.]